MPQDDIDHIPTIVPTRDTDQPRGATEAGARGNRSGAARRDATSTPTGGVLTRLGITVALVVAAVACTWAWQLEQALQESELRVQDYGERIQDLEARLSDTDEGMNQNAEVQAAKIRELDSEVRKLWDNVWKKASSRLDSLEQTTAAQGKKLDTTAANLSTAQGQLKSAGGDIASLKAVADDLEQVMASGRMRQAEVERVADTINQVNLDLARLNKRVQGNEEWIQSINAFRKQVNASLADLEAAVRAQPARSSTPPG